MTYNKKDLSLYRIQKAKEDFDAARELFDQKFFSQSINRSYYTMFHSARAVLALEGLDAKKHAGVIHLFNTNFVREGKIEERFGTFLQTAFNVRTRSDYHDFYIASKDDAQMHLENAKQFLLMIENYLSKILE